MKKIILSFICLFLMIGLVGCSSNENKMVEEIFLENNYYIGATDFGVAIKKYYPEEGMRCWAYSNTLDNKLSFLDNYLLNDISIDVKTGDVDANTSTLDDTKLEEELSKLKENADNELKTLNLTYEQILDYMNYKMKEDPKSVGDDKNAHADKDEYSKPLLNNTKLYFLTATHLFATDLKKELGSRTYSYNDIPFITEDCEWINNPVNKDRTLESGAFYRKMAMIIEGFNIGLNNGSQFSKNILGFKTSIKEEFEPYAKELSTYIKKDNPYKSIMNKFSTLSSIDGKIDTKANSYDFKIKDLSECAKELKISEEMLGYILAMLTEYAIEISFDGNTCSLKLN